MEPIKKKIEIGEHITLKFSVKFSSEDDPNLNEQTADQLQEYLENQMYNLEVNEPKDAGSDTYDEWPDKRDKMEGLISDVENRLDELVE